MKFRRLIVSLGRKRWTQIEEVDEITIAFADPLGAAIALLSSGKCNVGGVTPTPLFLCLSRMDASAQAIHNVVTVCFGMYRPVTGAVLFVQRLNSMQLGVCGHNLAGISPDHSPSAPQMAIGA